MTGLYPTVREEREMAAFERRQREIDAFRRVRMAVGGGGLETLTPLQALRLDSDGEGTLVSVRCYFCAGELRVDGYRIARVGPEAVVACAPPCEWSTP